MSRNFELLQQAEKEALLTPEGMPQPDRRETPRRVPVADTTDHEITKLVQRLFVRSGDSTGARVVSFSGISRHDRSGWICARAAEVLASQVESAVCVVDANCSNPNLHGYFHRENQIGLCTALSGDGAIRTYAAPVYRSNLWLMPAGLGLANVHTQLERSRARFAELREEFRYVLISAPSLARESEATFIGQLADGMVLVVEANKTKRESARQAKEQLEAAQVQILGAILDQRTFPIPEFLYRKI